MPHPGKHEAYSLLRDSSEDSRDEYPHDVPQHKHSFVKASACANLVLFLLNITAGFILLKMYATSFSELHIIHSPLNPLLRTTEDFWNLTLGDRTPFTEAPSTEVDALWDSISAPPGKVGTIRVSKEHLEKDGLKSVELADGSGYLATVDVFHQLHCLDFLRKQIFNSTYQLTLTSHPLQDDHIAHCIDSIRLSLQCSADVSLITWKWIKGYGNPWPDFRTKHECRNWDDILEWTWKESIDVKAKGMFVHPELGKVEDLEGKWFQNPLEGGRGVDFIDTN